MKNLKHRIHSATVCIIDLFMLIKIITNAPNLIYFHTVYKCIINGKNTYRTLYSVRSFSTSTLLSLRQPTVTKALLVKK